MFHYFIIHHHTGLIEAYCDCERFFCICGEHAAGTCNRLTKAYMRVFLKANSSAGDKKT